MGLRGINGTSVNGSVIPSRTGLIVSTVDITGLQNKREFGVIRAAYLSRSVAVLKSFRRSNWTTFTENFVATEQNQTVVFFFRKTNQQKVVESHLVPNTVWAEASPTAAPLSSCLQLCSSAVAALVYSVASGSSGSLLCVCTSPAPCLLMALLWACSVRGGGYQFRPQSWSRNRCHRRTRKRHWCLFSFIYLFSFKTHVDRRTDGQTEVSQVQTTGWVFGLFWQSCRSVWCRNHRTVEVNSDERLWSGEPTPPRSARWRPEVTRQERPD